MKGRRGGEKEISVFSPNIDEGVSVCVCVCVCVRERQSRFLLHCCQKSCCFIASSQSIQLNCQLFERKENASLHFHPSNSSPSLLSSTVYRVDQIVHAQHLLVTFFALLCMTRTMLYLHFVHTHYRHKLFLVSNVSIIKRSIRRPIRVGNWPALSGFARACLLPVALSILRPDMARAFVHRNIVEQLGILFMHQISF